MSASPILPGMWHHMSYPSKCLRAPTNIEEGLGFDGSSIRGFQQIEASDMILMPDPTKTAFIDPFCQHKTLVLIADIQRSDHPRLLPA